MTQIIQLMPAAFLVIWAIPIILDFYGYWKVDAYPKPLAWIMIGLHHMFTAAQYMMTIIPLAVFADALNVGFPIDPWIAFIAAALACRMLSPAIGIYAQIVGQHELTEQELMAIYERGREAGRRSMESLSKSKQNTAQEEKP